MGLSFLPEEIKNAVSHLNYNLLNELRIRFGQPVVVQYGGRYGYLSENGFTLSEREAVISGEVEQILNSATDGCIFNYAEQIKNGFITVEHGVRIGIAGEYVTESGKVKSIRGATSLNIRIPHEIDGCADRILSALFKSGIPSILIYSKPGLGKTTILRELVKKLTLRDFANLLVLDERNEISAMDGYGQGFNLGKADVVRSGIKLSAISSAIRAMKPDAVVCDELYGEDDYAAVRYAADCGISVIASSHITDEKKLKNLPFEYFVRLGSLGGEPEIYDKNFNSYSDSRSDDDAGGISFGE